MTVVLEGAQNFRSLGGLPLRGGGTTTDGVLYRSDALSTLTDAGLTALGSSDIGAVVDLRTDAERAMAPDLLPDRPMRTVSLPLLEGAAPGLAQQIPAGTQISPEMIRQALAAMPALSDLYVSMLQGGGTSFAHIAQLVAGSAGSTEPAVLIHCTAGKDRTGVAVALILDVAGVERDAIVADYAVSETYLAGPFADRMLGMLEGYGVPLTPQVRELVTGTPASAIEHALAWIDDNGGSRGYLAGAGVGDATLDAVAERLTAG
ncbi:tyrosine-protein phosphatase [Microbacterium awajiense]